MRGATVTRKRFEIEENGQIAYLEFDTEGEGWMTLWHTEVPPAMRGHGVATELAQAAFNYAREHGLRVDVICPSAAMFLSKHPEYVSNTGKRER
jgi:predicted GNAT family acetyltransferase